MLRLPETLWGQRPLGVELRDLAGPEERREENHKNVQLGRYFKGEIGLSQRLLADRIVEGELSGQRKWPRHRGKELLPERREENRVTLGPGEQVSHTWTQSHLKPEASCEPQHGMPTRSTFPLILCISVCFPSSLWIFFSFPLSLGEKDSLCSQPQETEAKLVFRAAHPLHWVLSCSCCKQAGITQPWGRSAEPGLPAAFSRTPASASGFTPAILVSATGIHANIASLLESHFLLFISSLTYRPLGFI